MIRFQYQYQYRIPGKALAAFAQRAALLIVSIRMIGPLVLLVGFLGATGAQAATFTVSKTADTNDGTCNADCSFREAIVAANGNGVPDTIAFSIPLADPGYNAGTGVFTITVSAPLLPALSNAGTTIDGTTQTTNVGDTNTGMLGVGGTVGVGADGVPGTGDEPTLSQVAAPEIEIVDGAGLGFGLRVQASNTIVRGIAIYGFGLSNTGESNIFVANGITGPLIEQNVIGSGAAAFADPGAGIRGFENIYSDGADGGTIRNNLIGFGGIRGILLAGNSLNWDIDDNEVRDNSLNDPFGDGIALDPGSADVTGNLIVGSASQGVVVRGATGSTFTNNTITGNGIGLVSASGNAGGMTFRSTGSGHTVELNEFIANYAAGLGVNNGATGITITRNSFSANGTITARNGDAATGQIGIDLNNPSDDASAGTSPFVSLNDSGDSLPGGNNLRNYPVLNTAVTSGGNLTLTGWARPGSVIEFYIANADPTGFGEGETYLVTLTEGSAADTDAGSGTYGPGAINGLLQGTDNTNRFRFVVPTPAGVAGGTTLTATATLGTNTSEFSGTVTVATVPQISGRVFEDANFTGTASAYDGGANDLALANVDVELYTSADAYVSSTVTDGSGNYAFSIGDGDYKIRVRSATIGDGNTNPAGGFNAACGITDPASGAACAVAEQTWGDAAPAYGGQSAAVDDTATANNAGPGDTWLPVTIAGADKNGLDFGFAYNLIVKAANSGQGSLRRFIDNANIIGAAGGTTANSSEFRMPVSDPNYNAGTGVFTITVTGSALPAIVDVNTVIDGGTQTNNIGNSNAGSFAHPFYGAAKNVGTGVDGIEGSGDEPVLPVYDNPEIEIDGNDQGIIVELAADGGQLKRLALFNAPSFATGVLASAGTANVIEDNFIGLRADGSDPGAGARVQHGIEVFGGTATVQNNVVAYTEDTSIIVDRDTLIRGNDVYSASLANPNGDGISAERTTGQTITVRENRIDFAAGYGLETWRATGPFTVDGNTVSRCGQGGGVENGGIRVFGTGSLVVHNVTTGNVGAGIALGQRGTPGSNQQNRISQNAIYANGGLGIDLDVTNIGIADNANGDGVTANNGTLSGTLPNSEMDYPVFTGARLTGTSLAVTGYVGTTGLRLAGTHTIEVFKAADDANNNGEIEIGDALNVPHGEGRWYIDSCTTAVTGDFTCNLTVPAAVTLGVGEAITATAGDVSDNTAEFAANITVTPGLTMRKRAFLLDGTPIATGTMLPQGVEFKFMLYINNLGLAATDVSIRDALDPLFAYQTGTLQVDNSVAACTLPNCTPAEESAIFASAVSAPLLTDAVDGDTASRSASTIDIGDQNVANARLDIAGARVIAVVFSAKVQ